MISSFLHPVLRLLVLGMLVLPAAAGEVDISVRFTVIGWADQSPAVSFKQGAGLVKLDILPFTRSRSHAYRGPAVMELYTASSKDKPAGEVRFPVGPKRFTILIGGSDQKIETKVIEDDVVGFPLGSARLYNLMNEPMAIRCNQKDMVQIPKGKQKIARPRPDEQLLLEAAVERDGEWVRTNDDFVHVPPGAQTSLFFFESNARFFKSIDGVSRSVQMLILHEVPGQDEPPKEPESISLTSNDPAFRVANKR